MSLAPLHGHGVDNSSVISGSYIVVFKKELSNDDVSAYIKSLREMFDGAGEGNSFKNEYNIGSFRGFSATMKADLLEKVRGLQYVEYVEFDQVVQAI